MRPHLQGTPFLGREGGRGVRSRLLTAATNNRYATPKPTCAFRGQRSACHLFVMPTAHRLGRTFPMAQPLHFLFNPVSAAPAATAELNPLNSWTSRILS